MPEISNGIQTNTNNASKNTIGPISIALSIGVLIAILATGFSLTPLLLFSLMIFETFSLAVEPKFLLISHWPLTGNICL